MESKYLIDKNKGYNGNIISTVYTDKDNIDRVAYSGEYINGKLSPDLALSEYAKTENIEPLVLTWDELSPYIEEYENKTFLLKPWAEITEKEFYEMFEVLPPLKYTHLSEGFFFFISEATTGHIHSAFIKYKNNYYTASRSRYSQPADLYNQLKSQLGEL